MRIFAFLAFFLLLGCSTKPASVSVAETAKESISALEKNLPAECKTEGIKAQLSVLGDLVENQLAICSTEKEVLKVKKQRSDMLAAVLMIVLLALATRKLYKKF